jgi:spore coat polysaccharide biosynthesis protein SpsF
MNLAAVVQARMSSRRFPGKVLALFHNEPTIVHVLRAVGAAVDAAAIVVATSTDESDDVLAGFLSSRGISVIRGDLHNVLARFQQAARATGAEWILRVSADSPVLDGGILRQVIDRARGESCDLVTTIFPRTFPKGRNAELIRASALLAIDAQAATAEEREHVTTYFYKRPDRFRIVNVESGNPALANESLAIDTPDDLARLEAMSDTLLATYAAPHESR